MKTSNPVLLIVYVVLALLVLVVVYSVITRVPPSQPILVCLGGLLGTAMGKVAVDTVMKRKQEQAAEEDDDVQPPK